MDDMKRFFIKLCDEDLQEISGALCIDEAVDYARRSLDSFNEVRVIEVLYRPITQTPFLVNKHEVSCNVR